MILAILLFGGIGPVSAAPPAGATKPVPGQFLTVNEPITSEQVGQLAAAATQVVAQAAVKGEQPVLVFDFRPSPSGTSSTGYGAALELASFISLKLGGARRTVAYVPAPLKGYSVLPALACDEIVMGNSASLGPITPEGQEVDPALRDPVRLLAQRKVRDPDLLLGMLDPSADLRVVRTTDKQVHHVTVDKLAAFRASHEIEKEGPAWEGAGRGELSVDMARAKGLCKLATDSPAELAGAYGLSGEASLDDPTLGQELRPVWIKIQGPIDTVKRAYLSRRIEQARQERVNLLFFEIDSQGGIDSAADGMADTIAAVKDMKTVAFVNDRALGVASLLALACNEIVLRKGASLGDVRQLVVGPNDEVQRLSPRQIQTLAGRAANLAEQKGHPAAVARKMVDPDAVLLQARDDLTAASCYVLQSQVQAEPGRYHGAEVRVKAGEVLRITGEQVATYGLGRAVGDVEELKSSYGLQGKPIRVDGPTWVDSLVLLLTDPFVSWILLFIGLFMLVLELKLPGIGLPAITSALAFALFFWSHYLSGTADQLEIILFLVGMVCLGLELFVFPGFGVFGMSGVLLVLTSIVMASHTFVWPTQEYEYREMGHTLLEVLVAMAAVVGGAAVLARYFPSLPLLNRLVLKAEPWTGVEDVEAKPSLDDYDSLAFLVGETGRTTTVLRPTGKARFGERLFDVTADGFYIEPDSLVEVVDVQGSRVIVKRVDA